MTLLTPANASWASAVTAWFDAADSGTLTIIDGAVSAWASKVGSGVVAAQGSAASRPAYSATALGGMPGLVFDGASRQLAITPVSTFVTDYAGSGLGFAGAAGTGGSFEAVFAVGPNAAEQMRFYGRYKSRIALSSYGADPTGADWTDGSAAIAAWSIAAQAGSGATTAILSLNGTAGTPQPHSYTAGANNSANIGHWANAGGQYWGGVVQEIIYLRREINVTERQELEGYLAWKWGRQADLPASHPYRTAAPQSGPVATGGSGAALLTAAGTIAAGTLPIRGSAAGTLVAASGSAVSRLSISATGLSPLAAAGCSGVAVMRIGGVAGATLAGATVAATVIRIGAITGSGGAILLPAGAGAAGTISGRSPPAHIVTVPLFAGLVRVPARAGAYVVTVPGG